MLKIKKSAKRTEPVQVTATVRGEEVGLLVRPWVDEEIEDLRKKNTAYTFAKDPETKQMVRVPVVDMENFGLDIMAHLLTGFSGFGDENGNALPVTRENKLLICTIPPAKGERSINEVIIETAKNLREMISVEAEAQRKNLNGSPSPSGTA